MSGAREFIDALERVQGGIATTPFSTSLTGATQTLIYTGPADISNIFLGASAVQASGLFDLQFIDQTATASGVTADIRLRFIPAGVTVLQFFPPLTFQKGIVMNYTASGNAGNVDCHVVFAPRTTQGGQGPAWKPGLP